MNGYVIPGTENNPLCPGGPYVASPGVRDAFSQYLFDKEARAKELELERAQEAADEVVTSVQKEVKAKTATVKVTFKVAKEPKTNDKKVAAKSIFDANKDKGNGEIAQLISKELEITYANAYYYVTRAFKR